MSTSTNKPLVCDGECSVNGECVGDVRLYKIVSHKNGCSVFNGLTFNYCETACRTDNSNGFTLKPVTE